MITHQYDQLGTVCIDFFILEESCEISWIFVKCHQRRTETIDSNRCSIKWTTLHNISTTDSCIRVMENECTSTWIELMENSGPITIIKNHSWNWQYGFRSFVRCCRNLLTGFFFLLCYFFFRLQILSFIWHCGKLVEMIMYTLLDRSFDSTEDIEFAVTCQEKKSSKLQSRWLVPDFAMIMMVKLYKFKGTYAFPRRQINEFRQAIAMIFKRQIAMASACNYS